jgi:ribonucleotide monophosphatase NagD (HAD superfamily)
VMIGDTPATDIAAAHAAGCRSILLLTGVGGGIGAAQVEALPSHERPTLVARDARELAAALTTLSEEHTG